MWRKLYHININQKKEGIPLLISDRDDLRVRKVIRDNEGCYIIIKWSVYSKKTQQSLVCMCLTPEVHVHRGATMLRGSKRVAICKQVQGLRGN